MVGLKTFWILISALFMLAACVPQTKQTECKSNEAFNASLRTCVPIVGGPSSFINISDYTPKFTQSRTKDDTSTMSFTISVSNPYNQSYSVEWERVFNAVPESICSNSLTCSFPASYLGVSLGQVGTHILTAKIKDGNGAVVDTHSFEIKINNLPKPIIGTPITPSYYAFDVLPTDPRVQFSLVIRNNGATMSMSDNYRTVWTVQKNGSTIYTESDAFSNFASDGTNMAYLGASPTPYFNPATLGVGTYIVRAVVQNDVPGEIVAEQHWSVIVKQPDLANVTNISHPAPGVTISAHHNVDYNDFPTYSWIDPGTPNTSVVHNRFCVTVDDGDGTYPGDGKAIQVRWYMNSLGGEICTKVTADVPGTQTICLVDANPCLGTGLPFNTDILKFSNTSPNVEQNHKVTARLFDEATSYEFERSDVVPSNGSYPIEWNVLVKPINTAPKLSFGTINPTGCSSNGASERINCQVDQGTNFTISFVVNDDFYNPATQGGEFRWTASLKRNGSDVVSAGTTTSCTKAFGSTVPAYGTQYTCTLAVPHFDASGPLHPTTLPYTVVVTAEDSGSPVGGISLAADSLTWKLVVKETNVEPLILYPQTNSDSDSHIARGTTIFNPSDVASFATEKDTITFVPRVNDPHRDDLQYRISLCTDNTPDCTAPLTITSPMYMTYTRSSQADPALNPVMISALTYTLPEHLLIGMHSPSIDIARNVSHPVYFKVEVVDKPSVGSTPTTSAYEIFSLYVQNFNPPPVIDVANAKPAVGTTTKVYSGYQFTIDPGPVSDPSVPAAERNLQYQWYSKIGAGAWTAIPKAEERVLRYTPGNTTSVIDLKICVGDGTAAHPVSATGTCAGNWSIQPVNYLQNLAGNGAGNVQNDMAVWYDDTNTVPNTQVIYSAYSDDSYNILVEKTIKDTNGNIVLSTNTVRFPATDAGTIDGVSNITISGSAGSIYVAYLASLDGVTAYYPMVRRISKDFVSGTHDKSALSHPAPFGFNYAHYQLTCSQADCIVAQGDGVGGNATITFATTLATNETVVINGVTLTAAATPSGANQICNNTSCATVTALAANVASKINSSTLPGLQGLTATASGGQVTIRNQYHDDYIDFDGTVTDIPAISSFAGGLGRMYVSGGRWHLPIINGSLSGAEQNNITVLSGRVDVHMRSINSDILTNNDLVDMGKVAAFDNKLSTAGEMIFAKISSEIDNAGALSIHRYVLNTTTWVPFDESASASTTDRSELALFPSYSFEYVKLAADQTGNPYFYVIAREQTSQGAEWHIGRYHNELDTTAVVSEYMLLDQLSTTDDTSTVVKNAAGTAIPDARFKNPDIVSVPGMSEARIFFHSVGTGTTAFPRLARWKADNKVACGTCFSLTGTLEYRPTAKMAISQIAHNITLGTASISDPTENTNDLVFAVFSTDLTATDVFKPQLAIINVEPEAIHSTTSNASGLFQPAFIIDP